MWRMIAAIGVLLLLCCAAARAEEGVLVLQVSEPSGKPLRGIQIGILGGHKDWTDDFGECRLRLPRAVSPGSVVDLQLGSQEAEPEAEWVFLDPWLSSRVVVPSLAAGTAGVVQVVLVRRDDRTLLENQAVVVAILSRLMTKITEQPLSGEVSDRESRRLQLREEIARALGLSVEEMDKAFRTTLAATEDPLEKGLLAFYEANYDEAETSFRLARTKAREKVTEGQEELAAANLHLGRTLLVRGQYLEALEVLTEASKLRPKAYATQTALAEALYRNGRYGSAEQVLKDLLALCVLGGEHPATLDVTVSLALTLKAQGKLSAARDLVEQVLKIRRRVLGAEHPATLAAMGNLASLLRVQGELSGARELAEQVLESRLRILGAEHPATVAAMGDLALTLRTQGELSGARDLTEQVLEIRRRVLGADHPDTLGAMSNLALTLKEMGDMLGARALEEQVLAIRSRVLGAEHPDTIVSHWNLWLTLTGMKDHAAAQSLLPPLCDLKNRNREQLSGQELYIVGRLEADHLCAQEEGSP